MKYVIKESVDARGHTRRTKKDTALVIIQNQEVVYLKQGDHISRSRIRWLRLHYERQSKTSCPTEKT